MTFPNPEWSYGEWRSHPAGRYLSNVPGYDATGLTPAEHYDVGYIGGTARRSDLSSILTYQGSGQPTATSGTIAITSLRVRGFSLDGDPYVVDYSAGTSARAPSSPWSSTSYDNLLAIGAVGWQIEGCTGYYLDYSLIEAVYGTATADTIMEVWWEEGDPVFYHELNLTVTHGTSPHILYRGGVSNTSSDNVDVVMGPTTYTYGDRNYILPGPSPTFEFRCRPSYYVTHRGGAGALSSVDATIDFDTAPKWNGTVPSVPGPWSYFVPGSLVTPPMPGTGTAYVWEVTLANIETEFCAWQVDTISTAVGTPPGWRPILSVAGPPPTGVIPNLTGRTDLRLTRSG